MLGKRIWAGKRKTYLYIAVDMLDDGVRARPDLLVLDVDRQLAGLLRSRVQVQLPRPTDTIGQRFLLGGLLCVRLLLAWCIEDHLVVFDLGLLGGVLGHLEVFPRPAWGLAGLGLVRRLGLDGEVCLNLVDGHVPHSTSATCCCCCRWRHAEHRGRDAGDRAHHRTRCGRQEHLDVGRSLLLCSGGLVWSGLV